MNGVIGEADQYIELISALRGASPTDEFIIRINSVGGDFAMDYEKELYEQLKEVESELALHGIIFSED